MQPSCGAGQMQRSDPQRAGGWGRGLALQKAPASQDLLRRGELGARGLCLGLGAELHPLWRKAL